MPITITREEVQCFLEEQGYDVSDEKTLLDFIRDFKKLIKFEEQKRRRRRLGHHPEDTVLDSTDGGHAQTTQDSSSYGEDHRGQQERSRQYQKSPRRKPPSPARKSPGRAAGPSSPGKKAPAGMSFRQPVGRDPQERTRDRPSYGADDENGTSSYGYYDDTDDEADGMKGIQQRPPQQGQPGFTSTQRQKATAPPKKQGNRLIMKRITAVQNPNGDSVLEESDVDLGPTRRPLNYKGPNRPVGRGRPQTAPAFRREQPEIGSNQPSRPVTRPISAHSRKNQEENPCDDDFEPDELFHALNELIFPNDQMDSKDSLFADSDRPKNLLRPPPHVAIDPVALYHWYKTYNWDVYSIPGEDRHMKLRWNVRAKTVGGYHPCIDPPKYYKPKRCGC